jgi:tRNA(adenine34) deaminase
MNSLDGRAEADFQSLRSTDERFMRLALLEASDALEKDETPVGAVVVHEGRVVGRGHNRVEALGDATAHAEILAIGAAAATLGDWRLNGATLYVNMEPCIMCTGSLLLSRIRRLVYGVRDPRAGACGSRLDLVQANPYQHEMMILDGCLAEESQALLSEFYRKLRD